MIQVLVYKYVTPDRTDVLEHCRMRFTQADALNDPFEINPYFGTLIEDASLNFGTTVARFAGTILSEEERRSFAHRAVLKIKTNLYRDFLMLSLTRKRNNLLMWSHYAQAHQGFVLGFDGHHPFFDPPPPRVMTPLLKVEYSSERFVVPPLEQWVTTVETMLPLVTRKSIEWAYEEELRMFARASAATATVQDLRGFPVYLFDFPPNCLKEIIFGFHVSPDVKARVLAIVNNLLPHVNIFQAKLNSRHFELDVVPEYTTSQR